MLEKIRELIDAKGAKAKSAVLTKYAGDGLFRDFLRYALNETFSYNLSEERLRLRDGEVFESREIDPYLLFRYCDGLSSRRGVDDETVRDVKALLYSDRMEPEDRILWIRLLAGTLRLGVTAKTVNKVIPDLIPVWEVQQAFPIDRYPIPDGTEFWLTQKLNGVRATLYDGELIARSGRPYTGLNHILGAIVEYADSWNVVFDGELTLKDRGELSDNEAFRIATGILNSDSEDKSVICYTIFDMIPMSDFTSDTPVFTYAMRRMYLDRFSDILKTDCTRVLPVLYHGTDQSRIWPLLDPMVAEDKEGLMLNTDVPYYRTRHRGILKVKQFYTMDLPVIGAEEGSGRLSSTLGALILDYKGNEVRVGSGFSDEQRRAYWQNRENLPMYMCEVKYKEISCDKNTGLESLQFPVFVRLREDKTDISYG